MTTKLWHDDKGDVEGALRTSLAKLKLDYVDLYLIHWMRPLVDWEDPEWKIKSPPHHKIWAEMERMVELGLVKSIGVSNCTIPMMADMLAYCKIKPVINQIECHPYLNQAASKQFYDKWGVIIEDYGAIGSGHFKLREDKLMDVSVLAEPVV